MRAAAALLACAAAMATLSACADGEAPDLERDDDGEPGTTESAAVPVNHPDETGSSRLAAAPLAFDRSELIDVRGVGDAGWSRTHQERPIAATFGQALDRFDPSGQSYRGDLSFINWETVVATRCTQFASVYVPKRSYAFVSLPDNLVQAHDRGFNLVGLSNNHTRDCYASPDVPERGEIAAATMTARAIDDLGDLDWLTAGVAGPGEDVKTARVRTFRVKGRDVRVAFGSFYTGRASCPRATCAGDARALMASMRDAAADLRILSIHSMASADHDTLVRLGIEFVESYGGDVVFGHGPHRWKPVRVVRKKGGGKGVVFDSLGNFLHPALAAQSRNFIGRVLFDKRTLALRQVQLLPVTNSGDALLTSNTDAMEVAANVKWTRLPGTRAGVYANVSE